MMVDPRRVRRTMRTRRGIYLRETVLRSTAEALSTGAVKTEEDLCLEERLIGRRSLWDTPSAAIRDLEIIGEITLPDDHGKFDFEVELPEPFCAGLTGAKGRVSADGNIAVDEYTVSMTLPIAAVSDDGQWTDCGHLKTTAVYDCNGKFRSAVRQIEWQ